MIPAADDRNTLFCSYARVDLEQVLPISDRLRESEFDIWIDVNDIPPAVDWMQEVERAIDASIAFILFLSPAYVRSNVCRHEADRARADGKRIVPVLIEECADLGELRWAADLNWIDVTGASDPSVISSEILAAVSSNPDWQSTHRQLLLRAREWDSAGRSRSRVLRGDDIAAAQTALAASRLPGDPQPVQVQHDLVAASVGVRQRQRRIAFGLAAAVTVTSLALGAVAVVQRNTAQSERRRAEEALVISSRLQAEAEARVLANASGDEPDPVWSTLYAIEALYRTPDPLPEALSAWLSSSRRYSELVLSPAGSLRLEEGESVVSLAPTGDAAVIRRDDDSGAIIGLDGEVIVADLPLRYSAPWNADGTLVAHDGDGTILITDRDGDTRVVAGIEDQRPSSWSPDGSFLVSLGEGSLSVIEVVDGDTALLGSISTGYTVPDISWSSDSRYLSVSSTELLGDFPDPYTQIIDLVGGGIGYEIYGSGSSPNGQVGFIRSGGRWTALLGSQEGDVGRIAESDFLREEPEVSSASEYALPSVGISIIASSRDGEDIAIGGADGSLRIGGRSAVPGDGAGPVTHINWDPSDTLLVAATEAGRLILAQRDGTVLGELTGRTPAQKPVSIAWSNNGDMVIVAWPDGEVTRLAVTRPLDLGLTAATAASTSLAWSPSGDQFAVGGADGRVEIVRSDGSPTGVIYTTADAGVFDGYPVSDMVWSPDGTYLAIEYGHGGFAALAADRVESIGSLQMRGLGPQGISWSPDGSVVVTRNIDLLPVFLSMDGQWSETLNGIAFSGDSFADVRYMSDGTLAVMDYDGLITGFASDGSIIFTTETAPYASLFGGTQDPLLVVTDDGARLLAENGGLSSPLVSDWQRGASFAWAPTDGRLTLSDGERAVLVFDGHGDEIQRVTVPVRRAITNVSWLGLDGDRILVRHADGDVWMVTLTTEDPTPIELGIRGVEKVIPSPTGTHLATVAVDGTVNVRVAVQPADLCAKLLELIDEGQFVASLRLLSSVRNCSSDAELAPVPSAPTSASSRTSAHGTATAGDTASPGESGHAADIDDLTRIRAAHDEESIVLGPVEAAGRTFLFSSSFEKPVANDFTIWELSHSGWAPVTEEVAPDSYFPYVYGLQELDVDDDGVSEVLVQFATNDFVGVVLRFSSGVWGAIAYGEGLEYIPGEGLFGVANDCDPSCAEGSAVYYTLVWDGTELVSQRTD